VALDRLRRWEIHFPGLATAIAARLGAGGQVEEVHAGRIWLLGRIALNGRPREVFIARGMLWADGEEAAAQATRLLASPRPIILVPGAVPPAEVWRGDPPQVLPLSALVSCDDAGLAIDIGFFARAAAGERGTRPAVAHCFPTPAGAAWEEVHLTAGEHRLCINVRGKRKTLTFQEAGFEDRRRGNVPDRLWGLLCAFARHGGIIPFDSPSLDKRSRDNLKQNVSKLGKRLAVLLAIKGNPFRDSRRSKRYETRFKVASEEGLRFPTPAGVAWDDINLAETRLGGIVISVETRESFAAYLAPDKEGNEPGRWEAAQGITDLTREYKLRALGLAGDDGQPDMRGEALIAVLRSGGKVRRSQADRAMLALGPCLCDLMQLEDPPFQFSPVTQVWSALFGASSAVSSDLREK
jgi:hypothetical protein